MSELNYVEEHYRHEPIEWRDIPGFNRYQISNKGTCRRKKDGVILNARKYVTSKGYYLGVSVIGDLWGSKGVTLQQLVALGFHGTPPYVDEYDETKWEVNHIDGNKLNNHPSNLEWVTRSGNLIHAHKTRLRKESVPVTMKDTITGETVQYYSIGDFARCNSLTSSKAQTAITDFVRFKLLYLDRYELHCDLSDHIVAKHSWVKTYVSKDYVTGDIQEWDDPLKMELTTGVIRSNVNAFIRKGKLPLVNGYCFQLKDSLKEWPEFTVEQALTSREKYAARSKPKPKQYGVIVYDCLTEEETVVKTAAEAETLTGVGNVTDKLRVGRTLPTRGYCFAYAGTNPKWPRFPDYVKALLKDIVKTEYPILKVTNKETGEKTAYKSMSAFSEALGYPEYFVGANYGNPTTRTILNKFDIEKVYLKDYYVQT